MKLEDIVERSFKSIGPQVCPSRRLHKLSSNPYPLARFSHRTFNGPAVGAGIDINTATSLAHRQNTKVGFYANLEQQLLDNVGVFARASSNDGHSESVSFTDVDRSLSGGVSIKGSFWGRKDDTLAIGAAVNGLSAAHRAWLAAGGLGILIGDGRLNYRSEDIFEGYYAWSIQKGLVATFHRSNHAPWHRNRILAP